MLRSGDGGRALSCGESLAVCVNATAIGGIEVVTVPLAFDAIKVGRDGRFRLRESVKADPPSDAEQIYEISGRLRGRRITGGCSRSAARRRRRSARHAGLPGADPRRSALMV